MVANLNQNQTGMISKEAVPDPESIYIACASAMQRIANAINPDPDTYAKAVRQLGASAVLFETFSGNVDKLYNAARYYQGEHRVQKQRADHIADLCEKKNAEIKLLNECDERQIKALDAVKRWFDDPKSKAFPDDLKDTINAICTGNI